MEQVVSPKSTPAAGSQLMGFALLMGRVHSRRRGIAQGKPVVLTILRLPAPDRFTAPATVEVRSRSPIGDIDDEVTVQVQVGGYGRTYEQKDKGDGAKTVQTADNTLTVVE